MLETISQMAVALAQSNVPAIPGPAAAAIGVGLAGLGTGIAQSRIGAAGVGAVAEDEDMFVLALIFTALPETIIIIAFVTIFLA
ncbi:MAG: hypothetical protein ABEI96_11745 [Haloarculaceae archaeon]